MITTWLEIVLSNAIVATVLAATAFVVARRLRPRWAFAVWLLVLVKLLMPPLWNAPLGSLRTWLPAADTAPALDQMAGVSLDRIPLNASAVPEAQLLSFPVSGGLSPHEAAHFAMPKVSMTAILFTLWCVGTAAWCLLASWRIHTFAMGLRRTRCAPCKLSNEVNALAAQLGLRRLPQVRLSSQRVLPLVWSLFCGPTILLPTGLLDTLSPPQRTALLMHELVHLRRRDHLAKLVELAALAFYWWLPAAWWARRKLEQAAEHCCDAEVVARLPNAAAAYAEALVATIDFLSKSSAPLPLGASGFSQFGHVSRRIEMILEPQPRRPRAWLPCLILVAASVAVLPLSVRTLWAEPITSPEAAATETSNEPADSREAKAAIENSDEKPESIEPSGSQLEGEDRADWNANYEVDQSKIDEQQAKIEEQLHGIVRSTKRNVSLVQTNLNRQEAAIRQAKAMQAAWDADTVTMDQLLEAQRRVAEAKTSYVRTVEGLYPESDRKQQLFIEANLMIADEAVNEARRTWAKAYRKSKVGRADGQEVAESQAREQFYQFKSQHRQLLDDYERVKERWRDRSDEAGPSPATPHKSDASSKSRSTEASETRLVEAASSAAEKTADPAPTLGLTLGSSLEAPADDEVLQALGRLMSKSGGSAPVKNLRIVKEKIATCVDPVQSYPLIGKAQRHHARYKCTVTFQDSAGKQTKEVVFLTRYQYRLAEKDWSTDARIGQTPLHREPVQIRYLQLQLAREEATLMGLKEEYRNQLAQHPNSAGIRAHDQSINDLGAKIAKAQWRITERERELNAAREMVSKRIAVDTAPSYDATHEYSIGDER